MSEDAKYQGIIAALVIALVITGSLYWKARGDLEDSERRVRMLYNMLPAGEQEFLRGTSSQPDDVPYQNPWDR